MEKHQYVKSGSLLTDFDTSLFGAGKHFRLYEKMGSHLGELNGEKGTYFAVWAPNAENVAVIGDFNYWNPAGYELFPRWDSSGIWEGFIPNVGKGAVYKYAIKSKFQVNLIEKGDPFALLWECPPRTASVVWENDFKWSDEKWMNSRAEHNSLNKPISVYELHIASWRRKANEDNRSLTYRELAVELVDYLKELEFTHVEFMPVMEHPYGPSWGYQITGYFAPSSRFGSPEDFMFLIDSLHKAGIGVYLDWVPSHYPGDAHGLYQFDGTHLYEHADPRKGYHPDWNSYIFNYGRNEVKSFLISNACFWLDRYHADGLRVDAVASMLYLDYSRKEGEWIPNQFGGRENLEAISLLKEMNEEVYKSFSGIQTIAEESTAYPMISRPTFLGGLGFGMKWMMGWMNDTLEYFKRPTVYRKYHQNNITFSLTYAFTENFMLPLSHDEVVHGKGSLLDRMPGDDWQRFANLRLLFGYMFTHPGTKLLFMGGELGQRHEWNHEQSLGWDYLQFSLHGGMQKWVKALNKLYKNTPALYEFNFSNEGFEWVDFNDAQNSVIIYKRKSSNPDESVYVVCNFTPSVQEAYRFGVAKSGQYFELLNSDSIEFGGSGFTNENTLIKAEPMPNHGRDYSIQIKLPPLGTAIFAMKKEPKKAKAKKVDKVVEADEKVIISKEKITKTSASKPKATRARK
jgi:1,4-alpha-glucan branching enzyme